jgi:transposase
VKKKSPPTGKTVAKTADVRAAVMAALLAGQGVSEVAEQFKVSKATVSRIKASISPDRLKQLETKKEEDFGALLSGYLHETIITLTEQARYFRNETWLAKQPAAEVAVLHGVQADKAFRLLEAIEQANLPDAQPDVPAIR